MRWHEDACFLYLRGRGSVYMSGQAAYLPAGSDCQHITYSSIIISISSCRERTAQYSPATVTQYAYPMRWATEETHKPLQYKTISYLAERLRVEGAVLRSDLQTVSVCFYESRYHADKNARRTALQLCRIDNVTGDEEEITVGPDSGGTEEVSDEEDMEDAEEDRLNSNSLFIYHC